jgi:diamine N-acetyltransferase
MSMCEGHYSEDAWMRAVYASSSSPDSSPNEALIGFLMLALWPPTHSYYIWRLMIDAPHQGQGYGRDVVRAAIEHVRETYPEARRLGVMSTPKEGCERKGVKAEDSPFVFYERLGFMQTEEPDEDGEVMMEIDL